VRDELRFSVPREVLHEHDDTACTADQVHASAHAPDHAARNHPVRQVTVDGDLHAAEHSHVEVAAANYREARRQVEVRGSWKYRDGLFPRIDEIRIQVVFAGEGPSAENAVLGVKDDPCSFGQESWYQSREADAKVDVLAGEVGGGPGGNLFA
jgi:hypothetical protein